VELRTKYRATLQAVCGEASRECEYGTEQYSTPHYSTVQKNAMQHLTAQCIAVQCCTLDSHITVYTRFTLHRTALHCTVLCSPKNMRLIAACHCAACVQADAKKATCLRKILRSIKANAGQDMAGRLQPLTSLLATQMLQADSVLSSRVFVGTARGLWDRHAREVLRFLETSKEGASWFKSASAGVALEVSTALYSTHCSVCCKALCSTVCCTVHCLLYYM